MDRIVVSPKAITLASTLYAASEGRETLTLDNAWLIAETGLLRDTVFRAFAELQELGAVVEFTKPREGVRNVTLNVAHWLFSAVAQDAEEVAA